MIHSKPLFLMIFAAISIGCSSMGPQSVVRDSYEYNDALGSTWKRQMLLNMVKLRYGDTPVFLDVASVINQYSREGQLSLNTPGWDRPNNVGPSVAGIGGRWADRPTITYVPISGEKFARSLLTPIPPVSLVAMVQSGWPVEFVFGVAVRSINGVANGTRSQLLRQEPDPIFGEVLQALTDIQRSSRIGMRIDRLDDGAVALIVLQKADLGSLEGPLRKVRERLGLESGTGEYRLMYGTISDRPDEIAILTRSVLEIIGEFSYGIEVPARHVEEGRVRSAPSFDSEWSPPSVHIQSGGSAPDDAFVKIRYRDLWFWIDDRDYPSKRMLSFLLLLTSLAETGVAPAAPLITVGAGG